MQPSVTVPRITAHLSERSSNNDLAVGECADIKHRAIDAGRRPAPFLVERAIGQQPRNVRIVLAIKGGKQTSDYDTAILLKSHRVNNAVGTHARREFRISGTIRIQPSHLSKRGTGQHSKLTHHHQFAIILNGNIADRFIGTSANGEDRVECSVRIQPGNVLGGHAGHLLEVATDDDTTIGLNRHSEHLAVHTNVNAECAVKNPVRIQSPQGIDRIAVNVFITATWNRLAIRLDSERPDDVIQACANVETAVHITVRVQPTHIAIVHAAHAGEIAAQQNAFVLIHKDGKHRPVGPALELEAGIHAAGHFIINDGHPDIGRLSQDRGSFQCDVRVHYCSNQVQLEGFQTLHLNVINNRNDDKARLLSGIEVDTTGALQVIDPVFRRSIDHVVLDGDRVDDATGSADLDRDRAAVFGRLHGINDQLK